MMLTENIRQAYNSLMINKKRSLLTMIGIVIGLSSVLFITSIGDTIIKVLDDYLTQNIYNGVSVELYSGYGESGMSDNMEKYTFSIDEIYDFIESTDGLIIDVDPISNSNISGTAQIDATHKSDVTVNGCSSSDEIVNKLRILSGRFVTRDDSRNKKPVAVISDITAEECFGSADAAVGKTIDITGVIEEYKGYNPETYEAIYDESAFTISLTVVGVYQYVSSGFTDFMMYGTSSASGTTKVYTPALYLSDEFNLTGAMNYKGTGEAVFMKFIIKDTKSVPAATAMIEDFAISKYGDDSQYEYDIYTSEQDMAQLKTVLKIITYAFSLIGAISLLVGGIGLMNTMLVSVTERTKEIGIMKALGAKTGTIRAQFLTESAFICLASCAIGVFFGFLFGMIIEANFDKLFNLVPSEELRYFLQNSDIHVTPSVGSIVFSSVFSILVGIVFGLYPANKGAKMQPVDALRYE